MKIVVEGNIGCGKTTFLKEIINAYKNTTQTSVVFEPVKQWEECVEGSSNLLEKFYADPPKYAFEFQTYALTTIYALYKAHNTPFCIYERSIYTNKHVFGLSAKRQYFTATQTIIYEHLLNTFINEMANDDIDYIIYLQSSPEKCLERIKHRNRNGETSITLEYLQHLHELHENWLNNNNNSNHKVIIINSDNVNIADYSQIYQNVKKEVYIKAK
jgi:deoxyadenosine/deoxycytidine kinase